MTLFILALSATALVACGDDDEGDTSAAQPAAAPATTAAPTTTTTTTQAAAAPSGPVAEIAEVRTLVGQAEAKLKAGDREAADRLLGDAYLEHYEEVEGPLGAKDHELMEKLEEAIATELRDKIKAGASAAELAPLFAEVRADLDKAEALLK